MRKFKNVLLVGAATAVLGVGVVVGTHQSKAPTVKAATETTVYYAVPSDVVGTYTVKLNINRQGDGDNWQIYTMTKLDGESYGGYDLYTYTYTDLYDGVGAMQFQLLDGETWISQQQPIGSWTRPEKYNGKVYVHDDGWHSYTQGLDTYIPMRTSFFTDWTDAAGSIASVDARFWGENYSFEALSPFFRGESAEGWTGTLTSRTWKQSTQYVYFQLGGARDYDHANGHTHLVFHYGSYSADFYNNTFVENPMTLRYFKIPDDKFAELTTNSDDFDMYVEIVDPATEGYGFANFGYLHANQTLESTGDAMRYFLNHLSNDSREWEVNKRKQIQNTYFENEAQREVFFAESGDISDHFNTNEDFTNHWYFDHNFFNNYYNDPRHFDDAISTNTFRPDDNANNMPFNNDGGFFRGWYEGADGNGFIASDAARYRFVSRAFTLSGTGIISVKMAGKASLHVIDATVKNTDSQAADLAWIDNKAMNQDGAWNNMAQSGFNTTAMVTHVINLEAYVGRKIQLAICDVDTSGWSACYFDELDVTYASRPAYHVDVATQSNNSGTFYPVYFDIYINSACKNDDNQFGVIYNGGNTVNTADDNAILNHVDSSASLGAYNVWKAYLDAARNGVQGSNYCSVLTSNPVKAFLADYNSLSVAAKQLVCDSDDFERVGSGDWWTINPVIYDNTHAYNLAQTIQYFGDENNIAVTVYSNGMVIRRNNLAIIPVDNNAIITIAVSTIVLMLTIGLIVYLRKKKRAQ